MFLDVYLGSIDDPALELDSDGLPRGIPYRVGPLFPGSRSRVFYMVREAIGTGELKGREVECAAWVAVVTKGELERFLAKAYPNPPLPQMALLPEYDDIPGLWAFVAQLAPDKKYALKVS